LDELVANPDKYLPENKTIETYILCRLGNDSQVAAATLRGLSRSNGLNGIVIKDVIGGLRMWAKGVDAGFPVY